MLRMKTHIKKRVIKELGDPITIQEGTIISNAPKLGFFDASNGQVVISSGIPRVAKHIVALHELLHVTDYMMQGIKDGKKRRTSHAWITSAAPTLLAILVLAGFWKGISKNDLRLFRARNQKGRRRNGR